MNTLQEELDRAIAALDAKEVAPAAPCRHLVKCLTPQDCAFVKRFAYYYEPENEWHVVGRAALRSLAGVHSENPGTLWEAVSAVRMPSWWTPDQQYACPENAP